MALPIEGSAEEMKVRGRIGCCGQMMEVCQLNGIALGCRGFNQRQAVLESIGVIAGQTPAAEFLHRFDGEGQVKKFFVRQSEQRHGARHDIASHRHGVGRIKEPPLKPPILPDCVMEPVTP